MKSFKKSFHWNCLRKRDEDREEIPGRYLYSVKQQTINKGQTSTDENTSHTTRSKSVIEPRTSSTIPRRMATVQPNTPSCRSLQRPLKSKEYEQYIDRKLRAIMSEHLGKKYVEVNQVLESGPPVARRPKHTLTQKIKEHRPSQNPKYSKYQIQKHSYDAPSTSVRFAPEPTRSYPVFTKPREPIYVNSLNLPPHVDRTCKPRHLLNQDMPIPISCKKMDLVKIEEFDLNKSTVMNCEKRL